jgi:hypothetical protein
MGSSEGFGMLYHWYELDLDEKVPAKLGEHVCDRFRTSILVFDSRVARERTLAGGCNMPDQRMAATASNDNKPDTMAVKLRAAGLGVIGTGAYRFERVKYSTFDQLLNLLRHIIQLPASILQSLRRPGTHHIVDDTPPSRHTMVLNDGDDECLMSADAKRPRFETSGA